MESYCSGNSKAHAITSNGEMKEMSKTKPKTKREREEENYSYEVFLSNLPYLTAHMKSKKKK